MKKSRKKTIKKKISTQIQKILKSKKIAIAVSGGIDSMVLLDVFNGLKDENNFNLLAIHFNHKWRKDSNKDAALIKKYCIENNIRFIYGEASKIKAKKTEEEARNLRYSFFKKVAKKQKIDFLCTAHHKDDQVETIVFRLLRGTGPGGLLPIKESLNFLPDTKLLRPFLNITKSEIYNYAKENKIPYRYDKTNEDIKYKRNLIRKKIVPLFKEVNKGAEQNILNCSDLIYSQNQVLNDYFNSLLKKISTGNLTLNKKKFLKLNKHTQKAFLYWFLSRLNIKGNVSGALDSLSKTDLDKKYRLVITQDKITFEDKTKKEKKKKQKNINIRFPLNGKIKKIALDNKNFLFLKPYNKKTFKKVFPKDKDRIAFVDFSGLKKKVLTIRNRKQGDIFQPLGLPQAIKFKKYLINKKIPLKIRYNLPLISSGHEILWVPGYAVSEKIKVKNTPTHILMMSNNQ